MADYYPFQTQCYIVFCRYLQGSSFNFNDLLTQCPGNTAVIYGLIVISQIFILNPFVSIGRTGTSNLCTLKSANQRTGTSTEISVSKVSL